MKDKSVVNVSMQAPLRSINIKNLNPYDYHFIKNYISFKKKENKEMYKKIGMNAGTTQSNILFSMILDCINNEIIKNKKFAKEFDKFCDDRWWNKRLQKKLSGEDKND